MCRPTTRPPSRRLSSASLLEPVHVLCTVFVRPRSGLLEWSGQGSLQLGRVQVPQTMQEAEHLQEMGLWEVVVGGFR